MDPIRLLIAQLNELSRRERVSTVVTFPALITIAWAHRAAIPMGYLLAWCGAVSLFLVIRISFASKALSLEKHAARAIGLRNLRIFFGALYGLVWSTMLFVLDSGAMDFLFIFKIATLVAVLGVTVNALSVVLSVYLSVLFPLVGGILVYLFTVDFLPTDARIALSLGIAVYAVLLMVASVSVARLTRHALIEHFERDEALAQARESHRVEMMLRETLEAESARLAEANRSLNEANERLTQLSRQDALTGTVNRRHLMEELDRQWQLRQRYHGEFSIILVDIDHFKSINDTQGHLVGDRVLIALTRLFKQNLRDIDLFGRWGGEEFLCLLPNTPFNEAMLCAERLRQNLAQARLIESLPEMRVTASFGVGTSQAGESVDALLNRVDMLLYAAKDAGRNLVRG